MKSMKTRLGLVALGIVAVSSFSLILATPNWSILSDPSNAVQHISEVIFLKDSSSNAESGVVLTNSGNYVKINTRRNGEDKNIVINGGTPLNFVDGTKGSHILGGKSNSIINGDYNTIIGGYDNEIEDANYSTIGGGIGNLIVGDYNVIAGGSGNRIAGGNYSSIPGGKHNVISGSYSVALGVNNMVHGDYSVALGSGSKVSANRSFLWTDGNQGDNVLGADDVFAVVSEKGMVINTDKPHNFAKLTVSGSLIIKSDGLDLECTGDTKGVIAAKNDNCLCSCDGSGWNALYRGCDGICNIGKKEPKCGSIEKICDGGGNYYSGGCIDGKVIEGTGSYFVDTGNNVYRTCQSDDGNTKQCSGSVTNNCSEIGEYVCDFSLIDTTNAVEIKGASSADIIRAKIYGSVEEANDNYCSWVCKEGYEISSDGIRCVEKGCESQSYSGYVFQSAENGSWVNSINSVVNNYGSGTKTCRLYALCDKGVLTGFVETGCVYKCNPGVVVDNNYNNYGLTKLYYPVSPIVESGVVVPVYTGVSTSFGELSCSGHAVCDLGNHLAFTGESICNTVSCTCPMTYTGGYTVDALSCGSEQGYVRSKPCATSGGSSGTQVCVTVFTCSDGNLIAGEEYCYGVCLDPDYLCTGNITEDEKDKILTGQSVASYEGENWTYIQRDDFNSNSHCKWTCNESIDNLVYTGGTCECINDTEWENGRCVIHNTEYKCGPTKNTCLGGVEPHDFDDSNPYYDTWQCGENKICPLCKDGREYNYMLINGGCDIMCHKCAKSGFPYCIPLDFRENCTEH